MVRLWSFPHNFHLNFTKILRGEKVKTKQKIIASLGFLMITLLFVSFIVLTMGNKEKEISLQPKENLTTENDESLLEVNSEGNENSEVEEVIVEDPIVYDNMTMEELAAKLDRSLNSTLAGTGHLFATYSLEYGIDPYLAVAIVLHETGCKWECSYLTRVCNNIGGQKGSPSCNGGSYMRYDTLEEGIKGYLKNLYNGYISKGLKTPEQIGPKYAASTSWASKVNWYFNDIKSK